LTTRGLGGLAGEPTRAKEKNCNEGEGHGGSLPKQGKRKRERASSARGEEEKRGSGTTVPGTSADRPRVSGADALDNRQ
jgi:hypothetical protein